MSLAATPSMQRMNDERIRFAQIEPTVAAGKYPVKRLLGQQVTIGATIFRNGNDVLGAAVRYYHERDREYHHAPLKNQGEDRWTASITLESLGVWIFTIVAWTDVFATWQKKLRIKWESGHRDVLLDFQEGAMLLRQLSERVPRGAARVPLMQAALLLGDPSHPIEESILIALNPVLAEMSMDHPDPAQVVSIDENFHIIVEPARAGFAAWYQLFPRSQSPIPGKHGSLRDVLRRFPELRDLGFDVVLFPPIHPIGMTNRKGKNHIGDAEPGDVGSPWAVGNWQGGHDAIDANLGTLDDFRMLLGAAQAHDLDIALELSFHCSSDHPYMKQCPHWFARRPDGSLAQNEEMPIKLQDVYPLDFDVIDWPSLWQETQRIITFWIEQGVKYFYIDAPHTKPVGLWDWLITQIQRKYSDIVLLTGSITRPALSQELARIGFSQCMTQFMNWNTKTELESHLQALTHGEITEYFRPHFFTNTPEVLSKFLQQGGKPAFATRLVLASTLSPLYGMYSGYENYEATPLHEDSEEYANSEIFEIVQRPAEYPGSLRPLIQLLNQTRRAHPALQRLDNLTFHHVTNPHLICYSKQTSDLGDRLICIVNLDPLHVLEGTVELHLETLGLNSDHTFYLHDLITNQTWNWNGSRNYVRIDPQIAPAHVCVVRVPVFKERHSVDRDSLESSERNELV
jgi:starch synthase (maltosyl-transferring)